MEHPVNEVCTEHEKPEEPEEEIAADQRPDYSNTQDGGAGSDEQDGSSLGFWGWLTGLFQRQSA